MEEEAIFPGRVGVKITVDLVFCGMITGVRSSNEESEDEDEDDEEVYTCHVICNDVMWCHMTSSSHRRTQM